MFCFPHPTEEWTGLFSFFCGFTCTPIGPVCRRDADHVLAATGILEQFYEIFRHITYITYICSDFKLQIIDLT